MTVSGWLAVVGMITGLTTLGALLLRRFPPKSTEQKVEDGDAAVDKQIADEQKSGRPQ